MTDSGFATDIDRIRAALNQANDNLASNRPITLTPLRDMIDGLTQAIGKQADSMDQGLRDMLAADLSALVDELETLEQLVEKRLVEEKN